MRAAYRNGHCTAVQFPALLLHRQNKETPNEEEGLLRARKRAMRRVALCASKAIWRLAQSGLERSWNDISTGSYWKL